MDPSNVANMVDHAGRWSWEAWFAAAMLGIVAIIVFASRWIVSKFNDTLQELKSQRDQKEQLFRDIITQMQKTHGEATDIIKSLAVTIDRNTEAMRENSEIMKRTRP